MTIKAIGARLLVGIVGSAGLGLLLGVGGGAAAAATNCTVSDGRQVEKIVGDGGCGAKAGPGSHASADEASGAGTAVAVSDNGGTAIARNLQPGSSALAGANTRGTALSVTTGPRATAIAQARDLGVTVAIGGWGGQAYAGPDGAICAGGFAAAIDSTTGKGCLKSGSIDLRN